MGGRTITVIHICQKASSEFSLFEAENAFIKMTTNIYLKIEQLPKLFATYQKQLYSLQWHSGFGLNIDWTVYTDLASQGLTSSWADRDTYTYQYECESWRVQYV